jgi:TetR/AcrR family transcriptional regulator, tetracycline repressor protein
VEVGEWSIACTVKDCCTPYKKFATVTRVALKSPLAVGLTRERIISEALAVIDADGVDAVSFRSLARRLGVNPTAIVWHVGTHEQLLSHVVASTLMVRPPTQAHATWQERVSLIAHMVRSELHRHPNLAKLIGTELTTNAVTHLDTFEFLLTALVDSGLNDDEVLRHFDALLGSIVGFVVLELSSAPTHGQAEWKEAVAKQRQSIDKNRHPQLHRFKKSLPRHLSFRTKGGAEASLERSFDALLALLIAGIEVIVSTRREVLKS